MDIKIRVHTFDKTRKMWLVCSQFPLADLFVIGVHWSKGDVWGPRCTNEMYL
jgi:hypothetical protein